MNAIVLEDSVRIPPQIKDLASFRRWARSEAFPDRGRFSFLDGELWIEMSPEDLYNHNQVKLEFARVIGSLLKEKAMGRYFPDGVLLTHIPANLSTEPDGLFAAWETLQQVKIRRVRGAEGYLELEGTPDMVLEIASRSSVRKDTILLRDLYRLTGVSEYWPVDARRDPLQFDILYLTGGRYIKAPKRGGWVKSKVFERSFKLSRYDDPLGDPDYTLQLR